MSEKYACKQVVANNLLDSRPEIKDSAIIAIRRNIAYKLAEIISDNEIHSIQLIEHKERTTESTSFVAELFIYR